MKSTVPCLQEGDLVGVVALSSLVEPEKLGEAVAFLDELGLRYIVGETIHAKHEYLAGSDEIRLADFHEMVKPRSQSNFCVKGGYGSARLAEKLIMP